MRCAPIRADLWRLSSPGRLPPTPGFVTPVRDPGTITKNPAKVVFIVIYDIVVRVGDP